MGSNRRRPTRRAPAPAVSPLPVVDVDPAMPTLGRSCRRGVDGDFYLLCRPGRLQIIPDGRSSSSVATVATAVAGLIIIVIVVTWLMRGGASNVLGWILGLILAAFLGVLAALPLFELKMYLDRSRERRRPELFVRVTRKNEMAWRLCETVRELVACRSWADRTVDPRRRIPGLFWAAVQRSAEIETQRDAVFRARSHPSLDDFARAAAAKAERERDALVVVAENLRAICDAASQIDRTRNQRMRQQQAARDKQLEERQLRSTLLGSTTSVEPERSENRADTAAGLAAHAETIAALLADTDRLLHT